MKAIVGAVFNEPSQQREFNFAGFVYSGLSSFAVGNKMNRSDFNQLMGRRFALPIEETKKLTRDMAREGYFLNGKRGITFIKPMPADKD